MQTVCCDRGCGRNVIPNPKSNIYSRVICVTCQTEIDSGRVVNRNGLLIDLPDEIRRYDKSGEVKVAVYIYKGRPRHMDHPDVPEITWKHFTQYLLHNRDFNGNWNLWIYKKPNDSGDGGVICMSSSCVRESADVYVKIAGGRLQ